MITYYKKTYSYNHQPELISNRWSIPERLIIASSWPTTRDSTWTIDSLSSDNSIFFIRIAPPLGNTDPKAIVYTENVVFPNNILSLIANNNQCNVSRILDSIEQLLQSNNTVTIELTQNQLAFVADLLNIKVNNRTTTMFIKEDCWLC